MTLPISEGELDEFFKLLKKLSDAFGVSGYEDEVRGIIIDEVREAADHVEVDRFGNVIAIKRGGRGTIKIVWDAHMDEIGFLVKHIDDKGFIYLSPVGGWTDHVLPGQRVRILTDNGTLVRGVIGIKPPHLMKQEERSQVIPLDKLFVDIGASSREEVEKLGIRIGSPVDLDRETIRLVGDRVTGKAFDDRVGVAVLIKAFKEFNPAEQTVYLVIATQEEVGLKGARVAAQKIQPEAAIAVDVTTANDVPGVEAKDRVAEVGKGPALTVADGRNASGLIAHPKLLKLLMETAKAEGIPYQLFILPGGTTDATAIALAGEGVPSAVVSVPTRYIHSPVELLSLRDAVYAAKLVAAATSRITREWYDREILWGKKIK
ncbi:Endoglucanase M [Hyperthermus butylicus DSM 5456]|uniref:Endoglucanase M n=1 Tax=Hyperthermus butylicus (strain DSM 5456 / JCM 9403 / PLM1-5) TaxID=415426 RepID=A2BLY0_HYPBU|nr:M42 family metallopeptidase [Hyperthermus butylicus]ABM80991.1 Endoglucanase M [Hyperthermus butylicus DSM 5456]